jgi:hypothetical protein
MFTLLMVSNAALSAEAVCPDSPHYDQVGVVCKVTWSCEWNGFIPFETFEWSENCQAGFMIGDFWNWVGVNIDQDAQMDGFWCDTDYLPMRGQWTFGTATFFKDYVGMCPS